MTESNNQKVITPCPNCGKKVRVPKIKKKIRVTCPGCRHIFSYRYSILALSEDVKRLMLCGAAGGAAGFLLSELLGRSYTAESMSGAIFVLVGTFALLGISIGGFLGGAEGYFHRNRYRMMYGIKMGVLLGGIGGAVAGLMAQAAFSVILSMGNTVDGQVPFVHMMLARTIGWAIFGSLLGAAYGIKENTLGDLKFGVLSGCIGGTIAGVLFDPLARAIQAGQGSVSRFAGFVILGLSLGTAIRYLQEAALRGERKDMFKTLSYRLPQNLRLE